MNLFKKDSYEKGFHDGEIATERILLSKFNSEKEEIKSGYEEQIVLLNFEIKRLEFKLKKTQVEYDKIQIDKVEAKKTMSQAKQKENALNSWKEDFVALLKQEEKIRVEPLQIMLQMVDGLDNKQLEAK